ncbi:hypothetical protein [Streptomyces lydicus]|uniref:hypothetical protein n=1 Tax=Streptomyces lydicus TaxID=47763 RepID=UPI0037ADB67E
MNSLAHSRLPLSRWIPLALALAVVNGCGPTGGPGDTPTPSPPPSTAPPPLPPPDEAVQGWHCRARTRLPETVEVNWSVAAPVHRAAAPDGTSVVAPGCRVLPSWV